MSISAASGFFVCVCVRERMEGNFNMNNLCGCVLEERIYELRSFSLSLSLMTSIVIYIAKYFVSLSTRLKQSNSFKVAQFTSRVLICGRLENYDSTLNQTV